MYLGPAIVTGTWLALIGFAVAVPAYWRKVRLEESALHAAFGSDWEGYVRKSWALVPGLF